MKILKVYVLKELIGPFLMSLLVFTFVMVLVNIYKVFDLIISKGIGINYVARWFLYLMPYLLSYTIPMSILTGTLIAFGRLAQDNEIMAMRASGISLYRIMSPVVVLGLILSLVSVHLNDRIIPKAHFAARRLLAEIGTRSPAAFLEAGTFIKTFGGYIIFIYELKEKENKLRHIRIYQPQEGRPTRTIIADRGEFISMPEKGMITLKLIDGTSDEPNPRDPSSFYKLNFDTYYLTLDLSESLGKGYVAKKLKDKTIDELRQEISRLRKKNVDTSPLLIEIHKKVSLGFASLAVVLIGLPLALIARRGERSIGFGIGLGVIVIYYILQAGGTALALKRTLPPTICMWSPNFLLAVVGVMLIRKTVER